MEFLEQRLQMLHSFCEASAEPETLEAFISLVEEKVDWTVPLSQLNKM